MKQLTGFQRGINLGGWLSQCTPTKEHYDTFITEQDLRTIASWGLDHVRLPIDYVLVEQEDGTPRGRRVPVHRNVYQVVPYIWAAHDFWMYTIQRGTALLDPDSSVRFFSDEGAAAACPATMGTAGPPVFSLQRDRFIRIAPRNRRPKGI